MKERLPKPPVNTPVSKGKPVDRPSPRPHTPSAPKITAAEGEARAPFGHDFSQVRIHADTSAAELDPPVTERPLEVQAAPSAAIARDEDDKEGGLFSSLASGAGSLLKEGWDDTKGAASTVYNGYEKSTDFNSLMHGNEKNADEAKGQFGEGFIRGGVNGEIDSMEKLAAQGNQKMVDDAQGHWYSGLAEGSAWLSNKTTEATGGLLKGVGDIGLGLANGIAHPIDALSGIEGIAEHNMTIPGLGTTLKAGHALYDLAAKDDPKDRQYGSSAGDIANHLFNPMQQSEDDAKFDTNLATSIIAPDKNKDGTTDWSAWKNKPMEAATRALTNIAPIALGVGEAAAGEGTAEVANAEGNMVSPKATTVEMPAVDPANPISPKATTVEMPATPADPVPAPEDPAPPSPANPAPASPVDPLGVTDPAPPALDSPPVKTRNPVQQMTAVDPAQAGGPQPPGFQSGPVSPAPPGNMPYNPNVVAINPAEVENALNAAAKGQPLPDVTPHGPFEPFEGRGPSSQPGWMSNQKTLPGIGPEPVEPMPETLDDPRQVNPLGKTAIDPLGQTDIPPVKAGPEFGTPEWEQQFPKAPEPSPGSQPALEDLPEPDTLRDPERAPDTIPETPIRETELWKKHMEGPEPPSSQDPFSAPEENGPASDAPAPAEEVSPQSNKTPVPQGTGGAAAQQAVEVREAQIAEGNEFMEALREQEGLSDSDIKKALQPPKEIEF